MSAAVLTLEHPVDPVWGGVLYPAGRCEWLDQELSSFKSSLTF